MSEWQNCLVEDIASPEKNSLATGPFGSAISSKYFVDNGIPVIRGGNLSADIGTRIIDDGFVFVTENKATEFYRSTVHKGDLIFTCWGTINQVGLIDKRSKYDEYIISNKQMKLTPDPQKADSLFLYYLFSGPEKQQEIINNSIGAAVPGFNLGQLRKMVLSLPPLPEQKTITAVLSSLDDKIDLLHRQNKTLEALAQTIFRHWFVDGAEDDWEARKLKDVCEIKNGYAFKSETYQETGYPIIRTLNFESNFVNLDKLVFISTEMAKEYKKYKLNRFDFLLVMVGASLGNFAIVTNDVLPSLQNQNMWCFRAKKIISQHYLNFALRNIIAENIHSATGSARQFFQKSAFYEFEITIPPSALMQQFTDIAEVVFSKIELNQTQIRTLEAQRDTLLPKLMSGEVRARL